MTSLSAIVSRAANYAEAVNLDGFDLSIRADGERIVVSFVPAYLGGDSANGYDNETEAFIGRLNAQIRELGYRYHDSGPESDGAGEWHVYLLREEDGSGVVVVGARVEAGSGLDHDTGTVDSIDGRHATVRWDSGVTTPAAVEDLRILD